MKINENYLIPLIGYALYVIFYISRLSWSKDNDFFLFGNLLLIIGYSLLVFYYFYHAKEQIAKEKKDKKEVEADEKLMKKYAVIGGILITSFFVLSYIIPITPHVSFYDIFGLLGYLLWTLKNSQIIDISPKFHRAFLAMYIICAVVTHPHIESIESGIQTLGRMILLSYNVDGLF